MAKYIFIPYFYGTIVFIISYYGIYNGNRILFKKCFWEGMIFALSTWLKNIWKSKFYAIYYELENFNKFDEDYYFKNDRHKHVDFVIDFAFLDFMYYNICKISGQNTDDVFAKTTIVWLINWLFNAQFENPLMLLFS